MHGLSLWLRWTESRGDRSRIGVLRLRFSRGEYLRSGWRHSWFERLRDEQQQRQMRGFFAPLRM